MTRSEFLQSIDEILELEPGTLKGDENLRDLEAWDSLAVASFIASVNAFFGVTPEAKKIKEAVTVSDLLVLVAAHLEG